MSPRNIFPSNIQGLPTWYEVRVTADGHLGARGGVDMMVAMNPQTWDKDVASIEPGGYLFYDSTKPMAVVEVPLRHHGSRRAAHRHHQLDLHRSAPAPAFQEHHLLGALSAMLDMDPKVIEALIGEQYKGKEKLLSSNVHALHLGPRLGADQPQVPDRLRVQKADKVGDRIFIEGNSAAALGAVYGGATVCAWYPITRHRRWPTPSPAIASGSATIPRPRRPNTPSFRARTSSPPRHRHRRVVEWRPRLHRHLRPGISLMTEFIGLSTSPKFPP